MNDDYQEFLLSKAPRAQAVGIHPSPVGAHLFDFQESVTKFAIEQGNAGIFLDTGLGKTAIQLEWCRQTATASNGRALILTPLAVARQIEKEAHRFGYDAHVIREQADVGVGINICNYDRLDKLRPEAFGAVSLDESSVLKSFSGTTKRMLVSMFRDHRFRLSCTATPAPNDHMEIGNHAEFLGVMPSNEMLMRWFIADQTEMGRYRIKRHGEEAFWEWMTTWARCAETPIDLGFDGSRFVLPPMRIERHRAMGDVRSPIGALFVEDVSATTIHDIKRQTADVRAEAVSRLVKGEPGEAWVVWCDTDYEADALMRVVPDAIEVRGSHLSERKEAALASFADGTARVIVTKPSVAGFGLNWQHAARMVFVGRSFSYESWYQAVRRCWRFGQTREVVVHLIVAEGEDQIGRVIDRKASAHSSMKRAMASAMKSSVAGRADVKTPYLPTHRAEFPAWIRSVA